VEDVMFSENLPIVTPDSPMSEAIQVVTSGKLGLGVVLNNTTLVGIITDGDIRRAMQRLGKAFFDAKVEQIMSRNPKTINQNAKIVEAGETMNHYSIHSLIVVDEHERVVGVIDSFSCLPGTRFYH
jgi:arabinose-5-phosphate isomerase